MDGTLIIQLLGIALAGGALIWYQIDKKNNS